MSDNGTSPKFTGVKVTLAGNEYVVPPLNLRQIQEHAALIDQLGPVTVGSLLKMQSSAKFYPILIAALSRNYPEISESIIDSISVPDALEYVRALVAAAFAEDISKRKIADSEEKSSEGEALRVAS